MADLGLEEPLGVLQHPAGGGPRHRGEHPAARDTTGKAVSLQARHRLPHRRPREAEVPAELELAGQPFVDGEVTADDPRLEDVEQLLVVGDR